MRETLFSGRQIIHTIAKWCTSESIIEVRGIKMARLFTFDANRHLMIGVSTARSHLQGQEMSVA